MSRPDWFKCDKCLWFQSFDGGWCNFYPETIGAIAAGYCSKWICKDCEGPWDEGENHLECLHVEVELED